MRARPCGVVRDTPLLWMKPHTRLGSSERDGTLFAMDDELEWPLRGWEAFDAGLVSVRELRRFYVPVHPGVHVPRGSRFRLLNAPVPLGRGLADAMCSPVCLPRQCWAPSG
jgi:hypothetical protein